MKTFGILTCPISPAGIQIERFYKSPHAIAELPFISPPPYNAAIKATPNPSMPPIPTIIPGAALELADPAALLELEAVGLLEALLDGLLVVAGTLVVIAVTLDVDTGIEGVVVTIDREDAPVVVAAEAEAREAENFAQSPIPMEATISRSD